MVNTLTIKMNLRKHFVIRCASQFVRLTVLPVSSERCATSIGHAAGLHGYGDPYPRARRPLGLVIPLLVPYTSWPDRSPRTRMSDFAMRGLLGTINKAGQVGTLLRGVSSFVPRRSKFRFSSSRFSAARCPRMGSRIQHTAPSNNDGQSPSKTYRFQSAAVEGLTKLGFRKCVDEYASLRNVRTLRKSRRILVI